MHARSEWELHCCINDIVIGRCGCLVLLVGILRVVVVVLVTHLAARNFDATHVHLDVSVVCPCSHVLQGEDPRRRLMLPLTLPLTHHLLDTAALVNRTTWCGHLLLGENF